MHIRTPNNANAHSKSGHYYTNKAKVSLASLLLLITVFSIQSHVTSTSIITGNYHLHDPSTNGSTSLTILVIPFPERGHYNGVKSLLRELAKRNHSVIVAMPDQQKEWLSKDGILDFQNIRFLSMGSSNIEELSNVTKTVSKSSTLKGTMALLDEFVKVQALVHQFVFPWLESNRVDAVVCDIVSFGGPDIRMKFSIPTVLFSPISIGFMSSQMPFWYPAFQSGFKPVMPFFQRLKNLGMNMVTEMGRTYMHSLLNANRNQVGLPPFESHEFSIPSIISSSWGFDYPVAIPPFLRMFGPIRDWLLRPLPEHLEKVMTMSPDIPIVYLAMGSVVELDSKAIDAFTRGIFNPGKWRVIWSIRKHLWPLIPMELQAHPDFNSSIFMFDWIDQESLLHDSRVSLFITHGGMNSVQESIHAKVPMLCIPDNGDQFDNCQRVHDWAIGVRVDKPADSIILKTALEKILLDIESFRKNILRVNKIIGQAGGVRAAADFVESIALFGDSHLIPARDSMKFYERSYLDVFGFLILIAVIFLMGCWRCCMKKRGKKSRKGKESGRKSGQGKESVQKNKGKEKSD